VIKINIKGKRVKENIEYRKIYGVWKNMMYRCYNPKNKEYRLYGGNGVVVCNRWKNLDNFIEDIDKIEGFDYELFFNYKNKLSLDKDKRNYNNKIYDITNCQFLLKEENNKFKPNQQKVVIGISPNNEEFQFYNQSEFARQHGLRQSSIGDCLNNKCKTHKGWKFYYKK